jgi:tRNA 2-selenouridine synthase
VYVESESKKVGNVAVPEALILAMRASPCIDLKLSDVERVALLLEDYDWFVQDPAFFCDRLEALTELRGKAVVASWQATVLAGRIPEVVRELLVSHYDPMYCASIQRNFCQYPQALQITATDRTPASMDALAMDLIAAEMHLA